MVTCSISGRCCGPSIPRSSQRSGEAPLGPSVLWCFCRPPRLFGLDAGVARRATLTTMASREITQRELRNESGEIMRQLDRGDTFVVTRNGVPVGELAPLRRHRFVSADTAIAAFRNAPAVDRDRLRADLDRVAGQDPGPRG